MVSRVHKEKSLSEVHSSVDIKQNVSVFKKMFAFFGPAYLVSVGYMDPGNWATDLAGGSKFGYTLIWVLLMSNIMALLLQSLSARLGIVRGKDLAQANHETYPKYVNLALYLLAEIAIAATDLAEVLGMAIGIQLLTGLPLTWGVAITVFDTILLLFLQRFGIRKMEAFIMALVVIVGLSFFIQIVIAKPVASEVVTGIIPSFPNEEALYIAIGIIGATVMPHNLYLHSALVQTRKIKKTKEGIKEAIKWNFIDSTIALNAAFLVNAAILILAATTFYKTGRTDVAEIKTAHELLPAFLGSKLAPILFAVALIAAGQSSTVTGTLAGQIVMEGYLQLRINPWVRRLLTRLLAIIPAVFVITLYGEDKVDVLLVLSQVILSMQLGFAIIPLIHFVSDKKLMGDFTIKTATKIFAWMVAAVLVSLNIKMVFNESMAFFTESENIFWKIIIVTAAAGFLILLGFIAVYPFAARQKKISTVQIHPSVMQLKEFAVPEFKKIAIALDFSENDQKLLSHAIGQGKPGTEYILIHIVESVPARLHGKNSDDFETRGDTERLESYTIQLKHYGINASSHIGYHHRAKEIVRLVNESGADMLVIGAHGHTGLKDFIYGETVNTVRHELKIPVLIVNL